MEQAEIEVAVGELETRMDRLRALYDQYFMGIERLEPLVPRKDVERRMAVLRKEQIRNTGLRYKFNMLIQRFNTNQTYWIRIARQIENGTYRRDIARATARFGVDPSKERVMDGSDVAPAAAKERAPERENAPSSAPRIYIPDEPVEERQSSHNLMEDDPFAEMGHAVVPVPRERFASSLQLDIDNLGEPLQEDDPFPKPPSGPKIRPRTASLPAEEEQRDTDRRIPVAPALRIAQRPGAPPPSSSGSASRPGAPPPPGSAASEGRVTIAKRASMPDSVEAAPPSRPGVPAPPPSRPGAPLPPPSRPGAPPPPPSRPGAPPPLPPAAAAALKRPGTLPGGIPVNPTITSASPVISEVQRRMTLQTPGMAPPPAGAAPPPTLSSHTSPATGEIQRRMTLPGGAPLPGGHKPVPGAPPVAPARPETVSGPPPAQQIAVSVPPGLSSARIAAVRPSSPEIQRVAVTAPRGSSPQLPVARPSAANIPATSPQPSAPAPAPARPGGLSGDRIDQIYSKYVETRRAHNEPTHAITREALAKQLADSTERLKQKHGGKSIDFEVVVKDGKTSLKPVVK